MPETIVLAGDRVEVRVLIADGGPVELASITPADGVSLVVPLPLVDLFTDTERKTRMTRSYVKSPLGSRLRYASHRIEHGTLTVVQQDPVTGLEVSSLLSVNESAAAVRFQHRITNRGEEPIVLVAITSAVVGLRRSDTLDIVWGESEWIAEGRMHERSLDSVAAPIGVGESNNEGRSHFHRTSHGSWSTGEYLPLGVLVDRTNGAALAWQIEATGGWHWELGQVGALDYLSLVGATDTEHSFATRIAPGETWESEPASLVVSMAGRDGALGELTRHRRTLRQLRPIDDALPVIYNDFMNTLMGDQSTEKLTPLVDAAADAGVDYFCMDAGWSADLSGVDWWSEVGEWREARGRFTGGLRALTDHIRDRGMVAGLWLEPEVVGVSSPAADTLPADAFFQRFGRRIREQNRFHLDLRHPAAVAHLDNTIDHLVSEYGIGYFKLDYNVNPGAGTDLDALAPGEGLLGHARAYRAWLSAAQVRHPEVLFETCASGSMRSDFGLLALAHVQSTSDQPDPLRYAAIAASAPVSILPEQCANWAYPSKEMSMEFTAFTLVNGLAGRLYLAGFLHLLSDEQRALVAEAVTVGKSWRTRLAQATPAWPLGFPGWDDNIVAVRFDLDDEALLAVWNRGADAATVTVPAPPSWSGPLAVSTVFPAFASDSVTADGSSFVLKLPQGPAARLYRLGVSG